MMYELAKSLVEITTKAKKKIATGESCTGGMLSSAITSVPGSSEVFERGFITYSYESKTEILGVPPYLIKTFGAVSSEVASEMVVGVMKQSYADFGVAITGIAGPTGATANKPVGLVYIATFDKGQVVCHEKNFAGDRESVRQQATKCALELLLEISNAY